MPIICILISPISLPDTYRILDILYCKHFWHYWNKYTFLSDKYRINSVQNLIFKFVYVVIKIWFLNLLIVVIQGNIAEEGRLLKVGHLTIVDALHVRHRRKVFLFENSIIFAKIRRASKSGPTGSDTYQFMSSFRVSAEPVLALHTVQSAW